MKKQAFPILIVITLIFVAFTAGVFLGRNAVGDPAQIHISAAPTQSTPADTTLPEDSTQETQAITYPININTADKYTLIQLPGIGDVLAERILSYRKEHGSFSAPEELLNVEGIGPGKLEAILELITTGG